MTDRVRSLKQEQAQLAAELRGLGQTWVAVAAEFRQRYRLNARVAFRLAHGWSQRQAADAWNARWPDEPKTLKNFSYWELWPSSTGHAPSFDSLSKLSQLYQCSVSDLLVDCPDYRHLDHAQAVMSPPPAESPMLAAPVIEPPILGVDTPEPLAALSSFFPSRAVAALVNDLTQADFRELAKVIIMGAERMNPNLSRRSLLFKLSTAFALAATSPLFDLCDPDEHQRVSRVLDDPNRLDEATLAHTEEILRRCRRQGDVLGPQITLQTALAQRQVVSTILKGALEPLKPRALSAYAELTQLVGWLLFNLGDYRSAQYYYEDSRASAHDAHNEDLVTYVLCTMSHLATWQGKLRVGIDHAIAAGAWAGQTGNPRARAYAADVAARAYAVDHQATKCYEALDQENVALVRIEPGAPVSSWWYFHDESFYWGTKSECALVFGQPDTAWEAAGHSLTLVDPANLHNYAHTLALQGEARIQQGELTEAVRIVGDVARLTAVSPSRRIDQRIDRLRDAVATREQKAVRQLDELLAAYRPPVGESGSTNRS